MPETVCAARWVANKIWERVPGHPASDCKIPMALSVEPVRQVGDGWRNADAAACQYWRSRCSAPTDTVVDFFQF